MKNIFITICMIFASCSTEKNNINNFSSSINEGEFYMQSFLNKNDKIHLVFKQGLQKKFNEDFNEFVDEYHKNQEKNLIKIREGGPIIKYTPPSNFEPDYEFVCYVGSNEKLRFNVKNKTYIFTAYNELNIRKYFTDDSWDKIYKKYHN